VVEEPVNPWLKIVATMLVALIAIGVAMELTKRGDPPAAAAASPTGTIHWTPKGSDPAPQLGRESWTWAYPATYAPRVRPGVGVYVGDERIGVVTASLVDQGSVWVYVHVDPIYERIAAGATATEPVETSDGPRLEIFRYSLSVAPPGGRMI
jgi:hypothetical protein